MEGINGLKAEVLQSRADIGYTEDEYWETVLSLSWNSLQYFNTQSTFLRSVSYNFLYSGVIHLKKLPNVT